MLRQRGGARGSGGVGGAVDGPVVKRPVMLPRRRQRVAPSPGHRRVIAGEGGAFVSPPAVRGESGFTSAFPRRMAQYSSLPARTRFADPAEWFQKATDYSRWAARRLGHDSVRPVSSKGLLPANSPGSPTVDERMDLLPERLDSTRAAEQPRAKLLRGQVCIHRVLPDPVFGKPGRREEDHRLFATRATMPTAATFCKIIKQVVPPRPTGKGRRKTRRTSRGRICPGGCPPVGPTPSFHRWAASRENSNASVWRILPVSLTGEGLRGEGRHLTRVSSRCTYPFRTVDESDDKKHGDQCTSPVRTSVRAPPGRPSSASLIEPLVSPAHHRSVTDEQAHRNALGMEHIVHPILLRTDSPEKAISGADPPLHVLDDLRRG